MGDSRILTQPVSKRIRNFQEVCLGFSKKSAVEEARRCIQCPDPVCVKTCPLKVNIPAFIRALREGNAVSAVTKIHEENPLASVCGRLCSAPCETACIFNEEHKPPIRVRLLERYAADFGRPKFMKRKSPALYATAPKVAVVGSGPAGLTAAFFLAQKGCRVTVLESFDQGGGVLRYGIPEFRLPKKNVDQQIGDLKALSVEMRTDCYVGRTVGLDELFQEGFAAVLLAVGRGVPRLADMPGVDGVGVCYSDEFLMRVNLTKDARDSEFSIGTKAVVIGSGNIALDCARAAVRLGAAAEVVADSPIPDKPAFKEDLEHGRAEGVLWEAPVKPLEILSKQDKSVRGVKCVRLDYAQGVREGQWELAPVPDSEFTVEADTVIIAAGHKPNVLLSRDVPGLKMNANGSFQVDEASGMTSVENVFAAVSNGPLVDAASAGKRTAEKILGYLKI